MKNEKDTKQTVKLTAETYKKLIQVCKIDLRISYQDYMEFAIEYCLKNKILPDARK